MDFLNILTKSSKLIATLGVVAGLGVAALPLGSVFALQTPQTVAGEVQVDVEVQPAIAMTIVGNNDDNQSYAAGATDDAGVSVYNPAALSTNADFDGYDATQSPAAAYDSSSLQRSSSYTSLLPNSIINGNDTNGFKSTINVYTNASAGYTLNVKDADSTLALSRDTSDGKAAAAIAPGTDLEAGTAGWGYKIDTASADGTGYTAITAADAQVKTRASKTDDGEETVVYYGVATDTDQATGVYTDVIIYTASTN